MKMSECEEHQRNPLKSDEETTEVSFTLSDNTYNCYFYLHSILMQSNLSLVVSLNFHKLLPTPLIKWKQAKK